MSAGDSREQQLRAVTAVMRAVPDAAERRRVLDALFAPPRVRAPRGFKGRPARDESGLKPHGTEAAYQRHKARGERACEACLAAANAARAESKRRVSARRAGEAP
ncbi:MAG TPA: hypothetical protein VFU74_21650 [Actinocrinis sp.]|nr:hypothetical protein [Actinocrinis sp.]